MVEERVQRGIAVILAAAFLALAPMAAEAQQANKVYRANIREIRRRAAGFVDKILKGAKPSELPVERPTRFELAVNLKTAEALGITIPPAIMIQAAAIIE